MYVNTSSGSRERPRASSVSLVRSRAQAGEPGSLWLRSRRRPQRWTRSGVPPLPPRPSAVCGCERSPLAPGVPRPVRGALSASLYLGANPRLTAALRPEERLDRVSCNRVLHSVQVARYDGLRPCGHHRREELVPRGLHAGHGARDDGATLLDRFAHKGQVKPPTVAASAQRGRQLDHGCGPQ